MHLTFYLNVFTRLLLLVANTPAGSGILLRGTTLARPLDVLEQFCRGARLRGAAGRKRGCC